MEENITTIPAPAQEPAQDAQDGEDLFSLALGTLDGKTFTTAETLDARHRTAFEDGIERAVKILKRKISLPRLTKSMPIKLDGIHLDAVSKAYREEDLYELYRILGSFKAATASWQ